MKVYKKLQLPADSSWDRKTWRRFFHWRITYFIDGVKNIFRWIPIIYKDRDFDDFYILKMLQKKIEFQREYIVKHNRHTQVDYDNHWMTVALNLIERETEDFYGLEMFNYIEDKITFVPTEESKDLYRMEKTVVKENLDDYLNKYPSSIRAVMKKNKNKDFADKETLSFYVANYNKKKSRNLLFEILKHKSELWWD